jgi:hypothetical protein
MTFSFPCSVILDLEISEVSEVSFCMGEKIN